MNTLDCLVYISRSKLSAEIAQKELHDIVKVSAFLNSQSSITGILTLQDGYFIQLLEGAPAALDLLMIHLHFDERHEDITVVARERIPRKQMVGWAMISPPQDTKAHDQITRMLDQPPSVIAPWRTALLELVGAPA
jgi:hypothetical protein